MLGSEYIEILKDMQIERLGVDNSIITSLHEENIFTIGDLLKKSNSELTAIADRRHFSIKTIVGRLQVVLNELVVKGISVAQKSPDMTVTIGSQKHMKSAEPQPATFTGQNIQNVGARDGFSNLSKSDFGSDPIRNHDEEKQNIDPLDKPIVDLSISNKSYYALRFSNIESIKDIITMDRMSLKRKHKRLDDTKINEIATAIIKIAKDFDVEKELYKYPFFEGEIASPEEVVMNVDDVTVDSRDEKCNKTDTTFKWSAVNPSLDAASEEEVIDTVKANQYLDAVTSINDDALYSYIKEALRSEYSNGKMWINLVELCKKIKESNPDLVLDDTFSKKAESILDRAPWATQISIYYCWKPDAAPQEDVDIENTIEKNQVTEESQVEREENKKTVSCNNSDELETKPDEKRDGEESFNNKNEEIGVEEDLSLENCIRRILQSRKANGREWVTAMSVYDVIRSDYPAVSEKAELVDIREVLTKSDWIQKDDFYYRIAGDNYIQEEPEYCPEKKPEPSPDNGHTSSVFTESFEDVQALDYVTEQEKLMDVDPESAVENSIYEFECTEKEIEQAVETESKTSNEDAYTSSSESVEKETDEFIMTLIGMTPQRKVMAVMDLPVEKLELSVRSYNCLKKAGILTIGDVLILSTEDLFRIRNLGGLSANEIIQKAKKIINNYSASEPPIEELTYVEELENQIDKLVEEDKDGSTASIEATLIGFIDRDKLALLDSVPIEALDLSRGYNCLKRAKIKTVGALLRLSEDEFIRIRNSGVATRQEIVRSLKAFVENLEYKYGEQIGTIINKEPETAIFEGRIIYNASIDEMKLSARAHNCLHRAGIDTLLQLAGMSRDDLLAIHGMGIGSANEITSVVEGYLNSEATYVAASDEELLKAKEDYYNSEGFRLQIKSLILKSLKDKEMGGASYDELLSLIGDDDAEIIEPLLKEILKDMVANGVIDIDNGMYKMHYLSITEALKDLSDDHRIMIHSRLNGQTLEEIAKQNGVTRERIRQIVDKDIKKLRNRYTLFSEDKYKYIYENYTISKTEWAEWFKEPEYIYHYLQTSYKRGFKPLIQALEDRNVDISIRRLIQAKDDENYIIVGNRRIPKERKEIEDYVIYLYFQDEGTVEEFYDKYEQFLKENEVKDANLSVTDEVRRTRENRISDSHKVLWKQNRRLRYYDIDGTDLDELFSTLCLEQYENTELSTLKFVRDFPDLMREYDIRDEYELHNLLKKTCDPSKYHSIDFGRMPGIKFGNSSRDSMVRDMLFRLAPVSQDDLADALSEEYGFKPQSIKANWLDCINVYYLNGYYHIEDEINTLISESQLEEIKTALTESFYFIDEVATVFSRVLGQAVKEPSSIVLKSIGFKVFSGYVIKGTASANDYFYHELTCEDIVDHSKYGTRIRQIMAYNIVMNALKEEYVIFEFEPFKFVNSRRLESFGVEKADIIRYCTEVKQFVGEDEYFTIPWLRKQGFTSNLDDLGFDDFFYEAILAMDPGIFCFIQRTGKKKGAALLRVGQKQGSKNDFLISLIEKEGSIDREDLISYCKDNYGMYYSEHNLFASIEESDVYYDSIMGKFYANYSLYYDEI